MIGRQRSADAMFPRKKISEIFLKPVLLQPMPDERPSRRSENSSLMNKNKIFLGGRIDFTFLN
jgi:hypothetical protein